MLTTEIKSATTPYRVPEAVTHLSFDIWNTLLRGNKEFTRPRLALIFELLGFPEWDAEQLRVAYLDTSDYFDDLSEETGLDYGMPDRLRRMYILLGIEQSVPGRDALAAIQRQVGRLRVDDRFMPPLTEPDLVETLTRLRDSGYRLGLLSNTGMDDRYVMQPVLEKLGIWQLCDAAIFSSEDGRAKPSPELFLHMAEKFDAKPGHVLHIGDNTNADYRAREAGLEAVVYAPKGSATHPFITSMRILLPLP